MVKGEQKGRIEGETRSRQEIARSMLADAMPVDLIAKFTGLSVDEIRALRSE
jgi:predicted transposase/invertase (TIGR01784 family)